MSWSTYCCENCISRPQVALRSTSIESPNAESRVDIPSEYVDLQEVFSKVKATKLPPHHPYDCAIELTEGSVPLKSRINLLKQLRKLCKSMFRRL